MVSEDKAWSLFRASSWSRHLSESPPLGLPSSQLLWLLSFRTQLLLALQSSVCPRPAPPHPLVACPLHALTPPLLPHPPCPSPSEVAQQLVLTLPSASLLWDSDFAEDFVFHLQKDITFCLFCVEVWSSWVWRSKGKWGAHFCLSPM